jgi:hypothetical protein
LTHWHQPQEAGKSEGRNGWKAGEQVLAARGLSPEPMTPIREWRAKDRRSGIAAPSTIGPRLNRHGDYTRDREITGTPPDLVALGPLGIWRFGV